MQVDGTMILCKSCQEQGTEDKFTLWEDGVANLVCPKCGKEEFEIIQDPDPLASWYKTTAVAVIQKPSEELNESISDRQPKVD